jgi:aminoglycoside phosphotransferase (APT) family kinase protein
VRRLAGGASRELWLVTLSGAEPSRLVLRRDPPGHVIESSRQGEFLLLRAAAEAGVPVPRVHWCEDDPAILGSSFFLMDFVEGEALARRLLRDDAYAVTRDVLPEQLATALAAIHRMDVASIAALARPVEGATPAAAELERFAQILHGMAPDPHPALELAIRWLGRRLPPAGRVALVHGDYRIGNVLFGPEGLRTVLDWELAHVGDPMEDIGWLCVRSWRFGADDRPVGGLCDRQRFWDAYARAGGQEVDPAVARWWEVFGNLKWAVICIMQAQTFLNGVRNVELASLGRRTVEMELELLDLMEA